MVGPSLVNKGSSHNCFYEAAISQTENTFKCNLDMRVQCAAFILTNPGYIESILPFIYVINTNQDPILRKQLLMEGGATEEKANDKPIEQSHHNDDTQDQSGPMTSTEHDGKFSLSLNSKNSLLSNKVSLILSIV